MVVGQDLCGEGLRGFGDGAGWARGVTTLDKNIREYILNIVG